MKKILLLVSIILVLSLISCAPPVPKTLRISAPAFVLKKTNINGAIERFKAAHPKITVELTQVDKWSGPTFVPEWQAGKTSADLFISGTGTMLAELIVGNWLEPLDGMLNDNMAPEKFVKAFLKEGEFNKPDGKGTYYPVIPFLGEEAIMGVNTEIFKKAGMWKDDKPVGLTSWDEKEFFAYFQKLKPFAEQGAHVEIWDKEFFQYDYLAPILAMTGTFEDKDGKGFDVTSEAAKKWLAMVQKLNKDKLANFTITDTAGYESWKTGKAATFFAAQGHTMELVLSAGKPADSIGYTSWPGAEKNGSIIWTHSVWIPKVSKAKELAKLFIKEQIFSKEFQQWQFNNWGKLPVMKEAFGDGIVKYQNYIPMILNNAEISKSIPLYKDLPTYKDILVKYLVQAATNKIPSEEALKKIKEESAKLDFTDIRSK